jgi:hypothetical protein
MSIWVVHVPENKRQAHKRLQRRTAALKQEHEGLSRERTPFNQADHTRHNEHLRKHMADLVEHQRRKNDEEVQ